MNRGEATRRAREAVCGMGIPTENVADLLMQVHAETFEEAAKICEESENKYYGCLVLQMRAKANEEIGKGEGGGMNQKLEAAENLWQEITHVVNDPGITWKVRRALLRDKFGFAEILIDELIGKEEPASDY